MKDKAAPHLDRTTELHRNLWGLRRSFDVQLFQKHGKIGIAEQTINNQPHRADIAKMLVHRRARRRGVAEALLRAAETTAAAMGKTVLVLDTVTGGDAERLYARAGWIKVGVIPDYALFPDGRYCDTTVFYKRVGS